MIVVISDFNNVLALLEMSNDINKCRKEYEKILDPGENPFLYNTDKQESWLKKVREREQFLTMKYGGTKGGDITYYSGLTFVNWLIREKDVKNLPFKEHIMVEFD